MTDDALPLNQILTLGIAIATIWATVQMSRGSLAPRPVPIILISGGLSILLSQMFGFARSPETAVWVIDFTSNPGSRTVSWLLTGIVWLALFHALKNVPLANLTARLVCVAAVMVFNFVISAPRLKLVTIIAGIDAPLLGWMPTSAGFDGFYSFPENALRFTYAAVLVWLVRKWQRAAQTGGNHVNSTVNAVGLGGIVMSKLTDQTTRLLCAAVVLGHGGAREAVLEWFKDPNRAVALELGVDLRLAAQVARWAERRKRRQWWLFFGAFIITSILWGALAEFGVLVGVILAASIWVVPRFQDGNRYAPMFWPGRFNAEEIGREFPADLEGPELAALPSLVQNFFVYGGFSPFVGAGSDFGGWSIAIALDKPKQSFGQPQLIEQFEIADLYTALDTGLDSLNMQGIDKQDCFFASGTDLRGESELLPDIYGRPVQRIEAAAAAKYLYRDDIKVRHYRSYRILDWGGEIALSYYIRCSRRGNTLFVETKRFLLTPIATSYRTVDTMTPMDLSEQLGSLLAALIVGPIQALVSPIWVLMEIQRIFTSTFSSEDRGRRLLIEKNPLFNYGTVQSLRQSVSGGEYGHYFQKIDGDFYNKLFEREVLDTLVEFLDEHGIDTSEIKERQTTILNSGVIVQGGDVNTESLAVGAGSQAVKNVKNVLKGKAAVKGAGA